MKREELFTKEQLKDFEYDAEPIESSATNPDYFTLEQQYKLGIISKETYENSKRKNCRDFNKKSKLLDGER